MNISTFFSIVSFRNNFIVKQLFVLTILFFTAQLTHAQVAGDFRTSGGGNWSDYTKWQVYDGTIWSAATAGQLPTSSTNVWLIVGNITTLTADAACNDIHIGASWGAYNAIQWATSRVALGTFTLRVSGKMACFTNATAFPGSPIGNYSLYQYPFVSSTGGKVSVVGNSRNLVNSGEWNTNLVTTNAGSFTLNIDLNASQTVTIPINFKASNINVNSGTLIETAAIFLENGTAGQGDFTIASGATFSSNNTAGTPILMRTWSGTTSLCTPAGTFTNNGTLLLGGAAPQITMTTITNNGTVEYNKSGVQTLLAGIGTGAATFGTYTNLKLNGTSAKTLSMATTVNGTLTLAGTASLALSTFNLTDGASSTLEYAGTVAQTMSNAGASEWSATPVNLLLNNSTGVTMADAKTVSGTLTLTSGALTIGNYNLTIGSSGSISGASSSSYIATTGTGSLIQDVTSGISKLFPIGASATSSYDPATLTATTGTTVSAKVSSTLAYHNLTVPSSVYLNPREWTIIPLTSSSTVVALTPSVLNNHQGIYNVMSGPEGYDNIAGNYIFSTATKSANTFTATYSDFTNPFVTATSDLSTAINNALSTKTTIYSKNGSLVVEGQKTGDRIEVYNTLGVKVMEAIAKASDNQFAINAKGVMIVKVGQNAVKILF
ncbi:MAG: hypothetical protein WCG93_01980 [Paludibacter sp.]